MKGCNEIENPCAKGFICVNGGRCEQSCQIDQHCMEGRYIFRVRCFKLINQEFILLNVGQYCHIDHLYCHNPCESNIDCKSGYQCYNSKSYKPCQSDSICGDNQYCDKYAGSLLGNLKLVFLFVLDKQDFVTSKMRNTGR